MLMIEAVQEIEQEQPKAPALLSIRITRQVPWKRSYRIGDVMELPWKQAKNLIDRGHAAKLSDMERWKFGLLTKGYSEETNAHKRLEARGEGSRHFEKTTRMIPIKITRNNGKPGAFEIGTISEMPFHEAMRLVEDGWAEHLTKAERDQHGFI